MGRSRKNTPKKNFKNSTSETDVFGSNKSGVKKQPKQETKITSMSTARVPGMAKKYPSRRGMLNIGKKLLEKKQNTDPKLLKVIVVQLSSDESGSESGSDDKVRLIASSKTKAKIPVRGSRSVRKKKALENRTKHQRFVKSKSGTKPSAKPVPSTSTSKSRARKRYINSLGKPIKYQTISLTKDQVLKRMVVPVRLLLRDIAIPQAHVPALPIPPSPGPICAELPSSSGTNTTNSTATIKFKGRNVLIAPNPELIEDKGYTVLKDSVPKSDPKPVIGPKSLVEKIDKVEEAPVESKPTVIIKRKSIMVGLKSKVAKLSSTKVKESTIKRKPNVGPTSKVKKAKLDESQGVNVTDSDKDEEVDFEGLEEAQAYPFGVANGNGPSLYSRTERNYEENEEDSPAEPVFFNLGNDIRKGLEGMALKSRSTSISPAKSVQSQSSASSVDQ